MKTAWMIRNDGKDFPCVQHIYANPDDVQETLFAAEWLYGHTRHEETKQLALETVATWAASLTNAKDKLSHVTDTIFKELHTFLSLEFYVDNQDEIEAIATDDLSLDALCKEVAAELNQEFLRARYGGMYHTEANSQDIFFRISSVGFDWYGIIRNFVTSVDYPIEHIIIVRDEESTGAENIVYLNLSTKEFLSAPPMRLTVDRHDRTIRGGMITRSMFAELEEGDSIRQRERNSMSIDYELLMREENRIVARGRWE